MSWFRTDDTMMDDAKIESLTSGQFRLWMRLLCAANQSHKPGIIGPLPWRGLYAKMHTGPKTFAKASALMAAMNMIEVEVLEDAGAGEMVKVTVVHFARRQYLKEGDDPEDGGHNGHRKPSDDPSRVKERVARHRDRLEVNELGASTVRVDDASVAAPCPPVVTPQNGDVTPPVTPPASRAPAPAPITQAEAEAESFVFTKAEAEAEASLPPSEDAVVSMTASAPPAPPFEDKSSSAHAHAPPTPTPIRLAGELPPILSKYDEQELQKSGWTHTEIDIGVAILLERREQGKRVDNARALLHKSILPEVRAGKRPKGKPPDSQEKITYTVNGGIPTELPCQHPPDMSALRNILHPPGQAQDSEGQHGGQAHGT